MRAYLRNGIVLLLLNIGIAACAGLTFVFLLFRNQPVIAVLPGTVALVGLLAQPWFALLLCLLPPYGFVFAPIISTVITLLVYGWLDRKGWLERPKQRLRGIPRRTLFMGSTLAIVLLLAVGYARYIDLPSLNHRAPRVLAEDTTVKAIRQHRTYCISDFINSEWLWQARVTPQQMTALRKRYSLNPIAIAKVPADFFTMPPYWWNPKRSSTTRAFATETSPAQVRSEDGTYILAVWDERSHVLHWWVKCNF